MKIRRAIWFGAILFAPLRYASGQDFVNLDFGSANIPSGATSGSFVPMSSAIPGWTGYLGANQQTTVLYDDLTIGEAAIAILDSNSPYSGSVIPGNAYTVVLQAGEVPSSIAQTALIPATARSILFDASMPYAAGWEVTIAGQSIPVRFISGISGDYGVYAGDVSAYAGQVATLEFTALIGPGATENLYLDPISFSTSPIPEPGVLGLLSLSALCIWWRVKRPNTALEPTLVTPVSFRFGFRVGGSHWRRGSAYGR